MNVSMTDSQKFTAEYGKPTDKRGNETTVQAGSVVWKSSDESIATVSPVSEDPIKGDVLAAGPIGVCEVWPEADADLGDGIVTVAGERIAVQVTSGQATGFGAPTATTPVEQ